MWRRSHPLWGQLPQLPLSQHQKWWQVLLDPRLLPIPHQLLKNTETGKYIDIGDLLPEALAKALDKSEQDSKEDAMVTSKHKLPINTTLDCALTFSTLVSHGQILHFCYCATPPRRGKVGVGSEPPHYTSGMHFHTLPTYTRHSHSPNTIRTVETSTHKNLPAIGLFTSAAPFVSSWGCTWSRHSDSWTS